MSDKKMLFEHIGGNVFKVVREMERDELFRGPEFDYDKDDILQHGKVQPSQGKGYESRPPYTPTRELERAVNLLKSHGEENKVIKLVHDFAKRNAEDGESGQKIALKIIEIYSKDLPKFFYKNPDDYLNNADPELAVKALEKELKDLQRGTTKLNLPLVINTQNYSENIQITIPMAIDIVNKSIIKLKGQ